MAWNMDGQKGSGTKSQGFVKEGNIDVYLFNENKTRVRFLTEEVDIEAIMADNKLTREQAEEYVNCELIFEKWVMPVAHWEHTIPGIQGQRYFTTHVCPGRRSCKLCAENDVAKNNGISENKLLPYPVRKRFYVPAHFYDLDKTLFVKGAQDFFDDIANYINQNGPDVDFEIYKTGKGFSTKYKSVFVGKSQKKDIPAVKIKPNELDFSATEEELNAKIKIGSFDRGNSGTPSEENKPNSENNEDAGSFKIPFGTHKDKTIQEVYELDKSWLEFVSQNSSGLLQEKVKEFLNGLR